MNNLTTTSFSIQAKSIFRYERNVNQSRQGRKMDTTISTITLTSTGVYDANTFSGKHMEGKDASRRFA